MNIRLKLLMGLLFVLLVTDVLLIKTIMMIVLIPLTVLSIVSVALELFGDNRDRG